MCEQPRGREPLIPGTSPGRKVRGSRRSLARDIAVVLAVKVMALGLLYCAFFGPSHRVAATAESTAQMLFAGASAMRSN
jgi:hypothetical protein